MEVRDLLSQYDFPGDDTPIVRGSALKALQGEAEWEAKIIELAGHLDNYIPEPERAIDKPFLLPIEDVFSISGRGTVVTGRVERGSRKVGEEVVIVGIIDTVKSTCTGVEMFRKLCLLYTSRPEMEKTSSIGSRNGLSIARSGLSLIHISARDGEDVFNWQQERVVNRTLWSVSYTHLGQRWRRRLQLAAGTGCQSHALVCLLYTSRPEMEKTSSIGSRNGLSIARSGLSLIHISARDGEDVFNWQQERVVNRTLWSVSYTHLGQRWRRRLQLAAGTGCQSHALVCLLYTSRPEMEKTSSIGSRNGLSIARSGLSLIHISARDGEDVFNWQQERVVNRTLWSVSYTHLGQRWRRRLQLAAGTGCQSHALVCLLYTSRPEMEKTSSIGSRNGLSIARSGLSLIHISARDGEDVFNWQQERVVNRTLWSVSYTHLHVYKRQPLVRVLLLKLSLNR